MSTIRIAPTTGTATGTTHVRTITGVTAGDVLEAWIGYEDVSGGNITISSVALSGPGGAVTITPITAVAERTVASRARMRRQRPYYALLAVSGDYTVTWNFSGTPPQGSQSILGTRQGVDQITPAIGDIVTGSPNGSAVATMTIQADSTTDRFSVLAMGEYASGQGFNSPVTDVQSINMFNLPSGYGQVAPPSTAAFDVTWPNSDFSPFTGVWVRWEAAAGGGDTTPPVLTNSNVTGGILTGTGGITANEAGTLYWQVNQSATPLSVPAVPAAMTGWTSRAMTATAQTWNLGTLTAGAGNYLHIVSQDAVVTPNRNATDLVVGPFTVDAVSGTTLYARGRITRPAGVGTPPYPANGATGIKGIAVKSNGTDSDWITATISSSDSTGYNFEFALPSSFAIAGDAMLVTITNNDALAAPISTSFVGVVRVLAAA
jgi:hypothetical protein